MDDGDRPQMGRRGAKRRRGWTCICICDCEIALFTKSCVASKALRKKWTRTPPADLKEEAGHTSMVSDEPGLDRAGATYRADPLGVNLTVVSVNDRQISMNISSAAPTA